MMGHQQCHAMEKVKQERKALLQKFRASPVFEDEIMQNLGL